MHPSLTTEQSEIVSLPPGAWLITAPPGCGKTEVLARRVEHILAQSDRAKSKVLVLTFTKRAADNVVTRVQARLPGHAPRVHAQRFHEFCHELLRLQAPDRLRTVYERRADRIDALRMALENEGMIKEEVELAPLLDRIELSKKTLAGEVSESSDATDDGFQAVFEAYAAQLKRMGACDFDDLVLDALDVLRQGDWPRDLYRQIYSSLLVDEAQDLNRSQYELISTLCGGALTDVMLFGDDRQSIFGFNGANIALLNQFEDDFKAQRRQLTLNFRSGRRIVKAANAVIEAVRDRKTAKLGDGPGLADGDVRVFEFSDEAQEGEGLAELIQGLLRDGVPASACHPGEERSVAPEGIAILGRSRRSLAHLEEVLEAKLGSVITSYGLEEAITSIPGQAAKWLLRSLSHPQDLVAQRHVENLDQADALVGELKSMAAVSTPETVVNALLSSLASRSVTDADTDALIASDLEWLQRVVSKKRRELGRDPSSAEFTQALTMEASRPIEGPGVRLLTIHAAKGQEFRVVCVVGMNEGSFPDFRAKTAESLEEERRLAYVAFTRASRILVLSRPQSVTTRYGARAVEPSPFLAEVQATLAQAKGKRP